MHVSTARRTGLAYLGLAVTGMLGFLVLRPQVVSDDPAATLTHLTDNPATAHLLVALELGVLLCQALAAIGFLSLWRDDAPVAGAATAAFGLMNAGAVLVSAAAMGAANALAGDPSVMSDPAGAVHVLVEVSSHAWGVGALFFGLWLIPMGWAAVSTRRMPAVLGWLLMVGGAGYVASAFVSYGWADAPAWLVEGLTLPATAGELWVIVYLLTVGLRPRATASSLPQARRAEAAAS